MHLRQISNVILPMLLMACASGPQPDATATVVIVPLTASPVVSGVGRATLVDRRGATDVSVTVSRVPWGVTLPVHLYTYVYRGSCGRLSPQPERELTKRVLAHNLGIGRAFRGPYTVGNTVAMPLAELRSAPRAILVKSAPADGGVDLYCGDIS